MKTVKELCLGVAVAGAVVGAGSALGCAVASASTDDAGRGDGASAADTSNASESTARGGKAGPARQAARAGADTSDRGAGRAVRNTASGGVTAAERVTAPAATVTAQSLPVSPPVNPLFPAPAPVALAAPASAATVRGSSANRTASQVAEPTHVLLIGVDGVNMSKVLEYAYDEPTSGFRILMDQGVTGTTSFVGHTTISGPSWSTILTGAWDDKTGVFNNIFNPAPYDSWPTAINLIEYNTPEVDTAVFANWQYINDIAAAGGYPADVNEFVPFDTSWEVTDDLVVQATIEQIAGTSASDSAFIFSYQVAVDEAGHEAGGDSPEYTAALLNTSKNLAAIMAAIDAWELANPGQQWTVISTTDHGHQPQAGFGHGFQSPDETASWIIYDREGDDIDDGRQNLGYSNTDITPSIVSLFGISQRSDFDGVSLDFKVPGVVAPTDRKQSLTDALGMYGFPDSITDFALSMRTVFGAVPYFLNGFVEDISEFLQGVVDQEILLISTLAQVAEFAVDFIGGALVDVTQAIAGVVATLTGSGVIPPSDPPLPPPSGASLPPAAAVPPSVLV